MSLHSFGLQPIHYENMKSGRKIYEGRLNDEKRQLFNIGDTIKVLKDPLREESFNVCIVNKFLFKSFKEMVDNIDIVKLGFVNESKEEVIATYREFYSASEEKKYGVVVFEVSLV